MAPLQGDLAEAAAWFDFLSDPANILAAANRAAAEIKSLPSDTAHDAAEAVKHTAHDAAEAVRHATYGWVFPALQILQWQAVIFALIVTLLRDLVDWGLLKWAAFIACMVMRQTFWLTHEWEMPFGDTKLNTLRVLLLLNAGRYCVELVVLPILRAIGRVLAFWWHYPAKRFTLLAVSAVAFVGSAGLWWLGIGAPWWVPTSLATVAVVVGAGVWFFVADDPETPGSTALLKKNAKLLRERVEELEREVKQLENKSNLSALRADRERLMLENARLLSDKVKQLEAENARLKEKPPLPPQASAAEPVQQGVPLGSDGFQQSRQQRRLQASRQRPRSPPDDE